MKALVLEDWWNLVVSELPDPMIGETEVLIEVLATGICGSDIHGFTGETGRRQQGQIMGHETVGRVVAVGSSVDRSGGVEPGVLATVNPVIGCGRCALCAAGENQACPNRQVIGVEPSISSAFAQLMAVPGDNVVVLNESMPPELGALIEPLSVGYHAARRGRIEEGDSVLVLGGGPIGQACVLGAIREGARTVVVSEPSASRRRLNEQLGAHSVDPTATSDVAESTIALIGDRPDVILDAVGTTATLADAFACSSSASLIVLVGMGAKTVELPAFEISTKERSVVGSFCYSKSEFRETAHWVSTVPPELGLLIDARVDLMTAPSTFAQLARGELDASKVLVLPNSSLFAPMPAGAVANP